MDLGAPISYLVLEPGTPVLSSDGEELGRVEHVLADREADVFDGRANPAVMDADPEDAEPEGLRDKLRRAWDLISGNY